MIDKSIVGNGQPQQQQRRCIEKWIRTSLIFLILLTITPIIVVEFNLLESRNDQDFTQLSHFVLEEFWHQRIVPGPNNKIIIEEKDDDEDEKKKKKQEEDNNDPAVRVEIAAGRDKELKNPKNIIISDLYALGDNHFESMPVARGVAGLPLSETPAVTDASRAHIHCDVNVDSLAYWNKQGTRDNEEFHSPFNAIEDSGEVKYLSFAADTGGWNNVRMSLEIIFTIAATTGRTLVLPPKENLYLLHHDEGNRHRGFADFFPLYEEKFKNRVKVISFSDFQHIEGGYSGRLKVPKHLTQQVMDASDHCDHKKKSKISCKAVNEYLTEVGTVPKFGAKHNCLVFDEDVYEGRDMNSESKERIQGICGERDIFYWTKSEMKDPLLIHLAANEKESRLLTHFYGFTFFTDPKIDNYYKRFVRDFVHYHDEIYCAAGKIVKALQLEGQQRGFKVDSEGAGGYSAMHIRRGDFQYKKVKIPASEWYENTKEIWQPKEILYIATDERNKTSLNDIAIHHDLRFLDDYWHLAGLGDLDPNYMGMVDTIVASRARAFAGTWFSTFSGYINRMRGYHGMPMKDSWYSFLPKKDAVHKWETPTSMTYAYEWPDGWIGIDADVWPKKDTF